jgi:RND family efflux transporter MFP subunit
MTARLCNPRRLGDAGLIALLILLVAGCSAKDAARSDPTRPVKTMVVAAGAETHVRSFPGKVEASKKVELAFQVPGEIVELPVKEGQRLVKGDLIAQLRQKDFVTDLKRRQSELDQARAVLRALRAGERPEQILRLEAQVRETEATMANARAELDRYTRLARSGAASQSDFDRAEANFQVARERHGAARQELEKGSIAREEDIEAKEATVRGLEAQVVQANIRLQDSTLHAPYDGVIAQRFVEPKQQITAKQPIVKFQDVDEIDVVVDVPETVMASLRAADIVHIQAEFSGAPGIQFPIHIKEVAQRADATTQTFQVRVAMKAPSEVSILPGMSATVALTYRRASILGNRILVPISAVANDASGEPGAWVLGSDQTVSRRSVKVGQATGSQIEVVDGLRPGDRIVVAGVSFLREGMKVHDLGDALGGG